MKELTIISGKGGTGKTSIVASFSALCENKIIVDADVDAANLHLVLNPHIRQETEFKGGNFASINPDLCVECGECIERCQFGAISDDFVVDSIECEGCGVCVHFCPEKAIDFPQRVCGRWYISETRMGTMVHAKLGIAEENSGLLVSILRKEAKDLAEKENSHLIIVDGPPGTGCPVISSVTGADAVLIITEPTLSGLHDMERVKSLADFLKVKTFLCINKADLNPEISGRLKEFANNNNMVFTGEIPYDKDFTSAMVQGKTLVEFSDGPCSKAIKRVWESLSANLNEI